MKFRILAMVLVVLALLPTGVFAQDDGMMAVESAVVGIDPNRIARMLCPRER